MLDKRRHPALGVFLPVGYLDVAGGVDALLTFAYSGASILEVGVPHYDASFDGPVITSAYRRALQRGTDMQHVLTTVREAALGTPAAVVVMSYWHPVLRYGVERFAADLARAGGAGAMIPDLPIEEAAPWLSAARSAGIHTPQFVSRRGGDDRLARVAEGASGWLYAPAADSVTGFQGVLDYSALDSFTRRIRRISSLPVVTGIGVNEAEQARRVGSIADAVVTGSALLLRLQSHGLKGAAELVSEFAEALLHPAHPGV
ncbi:hypothetical protein AN218_23165 [Streptomyces nanshensis]|uniref:Tryptophan synthase alpha chain n=1 Tax=Streptomyces nanshensis TaxID=518642 RepID=A0A1E7KZP6_9ACTN|nr:hypothetical protein AN218_23165 [Streptomyces nanshensis]